MRLYIGIGLMVVMLLGGILLTVAFDALHKPLTAQLEQAQEAVLAGDWEKATALADSARAKWMRFRRFAAAVADHEPLEQMDSLFARLEILGKLREEDEFAADCAELSRLAEAMAESQALTWWSLL